VPPDRRSTLRIGCSGWNYASWKPFYGGRPQREWLALYARHFDTVEVNNTFYRLPDRSAVEGWERTAPPGFCFAVKVSRYLTHIKRLRDLGPGLERFFERIEPLTPNLGPLLWQLPPNFPRDDERLAAALAVLPQGRHAFEFRHLSWFADEVYARLRERDVALVVVDAAQEPIGSWAYVRFHHGVRGRRGNYSASELREWAERIRAWDVDTYAYFNNDWEAFAVKNAIRLKELLYV
jgi:uncharacterized protein YecE (DUF72 family)